MSAGTGVGFQTMATGRPEFLDMAVDMALSLRAHTDHPIALAADSVIAERASQRFPSVFDHVHLIPARFLHGRIRKFGCAEASPFARTVFIDADCIVLDSLDHLFDPLASAPMAMLGELLTRSDDENHHGFSTRRLMQQFDLDHYLKTNSGLFAYRDDARPIFEECRTCFLDEARPRLKRSIVLGKWLGDEIAFGIVGGRRRVSSLPLPHAMYWPQEFDSIDLDAPTKPLLHFIWPPRAKTLERLLDDIRGRRREAGLTTEGSEVWRVEARKLQKMKRRREWAERFGLWG
ncbi:MAG: hypothetical protein AAF389_00645 [Gemmatimonadota bacterium]